MQPTKIKTPFLINFFFHILLILPPLAVFAIYEAVDAKTTPTAWTCRIEWEDGFFKEIQPSPCTWYFPMFTKQEIAHLQRKKESRFIYYITYIKELNFYINNQY